MAVPTEVLELMQKFKNMTIDNGCTPSEAENAAARLHALLQKHQLAMADLETKSIAEEVEMMNLERKDNKRWGYGVIEFAGSVGGAFDCQVIYSKWRITFIGIESDVRVASFFFDQTHPKVLAAGREIGRMQGVNGASLAHYVQNFISGAGRAIYGRLRKQTEDTALREMAKGNANAGALVPVKKQKVDEFKKEKFPILGHANDRQLRDGAYDRHVFGSEMDLQRGLDVPKGGPAVAALNGGARP
jgi:hypothetical protein